jgi:Ca2+-binding RTX toxin-like protein
MRVLRLAGLALALLALTPAAAAAAGAVSTDSSGNPTYDGDSSANVVTVNGTSGNPGTVTFAEPGITEGTDMATECTPTTDLVTCSTPPTAFITMHGGAGEDQLTVNGNVVANLRGDSENDRLTGGDGGDDLDGGTGADELFGRGGSDFDSAEPGAGNLIDMGAGADSVFVTNGSGGADALHGGTGEDTLTYSWTGAPVSFRIDLAAGTLSHDGAPSEPADTISEFEDVVANDFFATTADDVVIGSNGPNMLAAGGGNDTVDGGAGTDTLLPDQGEGVFGIANTGSGNDTVGARDGFADHIDCGAGADSAQIDQFDAPLVSASCESVQQADAAAFGIQPPAPTPAPDKTAPSCKRSRLGKKKRSSFLRSGFVVSYACNEEARLDLSVLVRVKRTRNGKVTLSRAGDLVLAERRLGFSTKKRKVRLRVARSLRRALGKRFKVTVRAVATDRAGNQRTTSASFAVR